MNEQNDNNKSKFTVFSWMIKQFVNCGCEHRKFEEWDTSSCSTHISRRITDVELIKVYFRIFMSFSVQ